MTAVDRGEAKRARPHPHRYHPTPMALVTLQHIPKSYAPVGSAAALPQPAGASGGPVWGWDASVA